MKNISWSQEETILALDLYFKLEGRIPDVRDPEIIALSALMAELSLIDEKHESRTGRSKSSIIFKLSNFRSLDQDAKKSGLVGLQNVSELDKQLWDQFSNNKDELHRLANEIRKKIAENRDQFEPVKANLHILRLLGDELIGTPQLAVFELVKNAYDADASRVNVTLELKSTDPSITIIDNGKGMTISDIRNGWLQIGTPAKRGTNRIRTEIYGRMPLGEKGVGRLAGFKLGDRLEMITKQKEGQEYHLIMDLGRILGTNEDDDRSVEDVRIRVAPVYEDCRFNGTDKCGTYIRINKLRKDLIWGTRELKALQRLINSLTSPFKSKGEFFPTLSAPGHEKEISQLPDTEVLLEKAPWIFRFRISKNSTYRWTYRFCPPPGFRGLSPTKKSSRELMADFQKLELSAETRDDDIPPRPSRDKLYLNAEDIEGIGPVSGQLYVYDLRTEILKHIGGSQGAKMILSNQGGMRVYRDGIRVFNYGEPGDDWLELNIQRVNKPGKTLATNSFIGAVEVDLESSSGLKEKTNREGFDDNLTFRLFRQIIQSIIDHFNILRQKDRSSLDNILKGDPVREDAPGKFNLAIEKISQAAEASGIKNIVEPHIKQVVKQYDTLQQVVASSGAGLNLAIIFHEVERGINEILKGLESGENAETLKIKASNIAIILDGFSSLLRKSERKTLQVSTLVKRAIQLSQSRFTAHKIIISAPILTGEDQDFTISGAFNFYLSTLLNLIDNSIYWIRRRTELEKDHVPRAMLIRTLPDWAAEGPSLAVLDNGPGFTITSEEATRAYSTTKPGGMGLGLFFASMAMESNGGDLIIPGNIEDLDIDTPLTGAAVIMRFRRTR